MTSAGGTSQLVRLRAVHDVASVGTSITTHGSMSSPLVAVDGVPTPLQEWSVWAGLYDEFRVIKVTLAWFPFRPNDETPTSSFKPIAIAYDVDASGSFLASYDVAVAYASVRMKNIFAAWRTTFRAVYPAGMSSQGWQNADTPVNLGRWQLYADNLTANVGYGKLLVTTTLQFRSRR